jgi:UDP-glucose:(heptosyl)LPS alpha-1,3-glucosyltransferase
MAGKPRIAVVSPFLDKQHGTERCIAEQVERLAAEYEIHIYSMRVEDLDRGKFILHRIPRLPGPHLFHYLWWFAANQLWRWRDRRFRGMRFDLVYSPGINCFDADAIAVHIVFAAFRRQVEGELRLRRNPLRSWPHVIHRRLYYRLIEALEGRIYTRKDLPMAIVSRKVGGDLEKFYGRTDGLFLVYNGLDLDRFEPARRTRRREGARRELGLAGGDFAVLLIGNDWKKKGLPCLLEAAGQLRLPDLQILVVGRDTATPYESTIQRLGLGARVRFLPPRPDVEFYYAAADAYAGPSLEDAFALPPAEAMACGLPVIVSREAGVSEIVTHNVDGLILEDPTNAADLAKFLEQLHQDANLRQRLGENAARAVLQYTWSRNAAETQRLLESARRSRERAAGAANRIANSGG